MVAGRFRMQVQHGREWGVATWQRQHRQGSQTRRLLVKAECLCLYPLPQWPQHSCSHPRTGGGRSQARPSSACLQRAQKLLCCCHWSSLMMDGRPLFMKDNGPLEPWRKSMKRTEEGLCGTKSKGNLGVLFPEP